MKTRVVSCVERLREMQAHGEFGHWENAVLDEVIRELDEAAKTESDVQMRGALHACVRRIAWLVLLHLSDFFDGDE